MRRNQQIDLGLYRRGLSGRIVYPTDAASNLAEDYMVSAKDVYPFGQSSDAWKSMRGAWYSYINGQGNASSEINKAIVKDTQNASYTDWSNTALGQWITVITTAVWKNIGWWPTDAKTAALQPEGMLVLGNLMALYAYQQRNPKAFNAAYAQLSTNQSRMPVCYLDALEIPSSYGLKAYNLLPDGFAMPVAQYSASGTQEQKEEAPNNLVKPVSSYYKVDDGKTSVRVRMAPSTSAEILKAVNGPLSALVTTNTEGWFGVKLSDGTSGWISSNLLKEISKSEFDKLVSSESGTKTTYTPPDKYTPPPTKYTPPTTTYTPPTNTYVPTANNITQTDNSTVDNTPIVVPKKDNTMLYVGIGAGVLALLGAIFMIRTRPPESAE